MELKFTNERTKKYRFSFAAWKFLIGVHTIFARYNGCGNHSGVVDRPTIVIWNSSANYFDYHCPSVVPCQIDFPVFKKSQRNFKINFTVP